MALRSRHRLGSDIKSELITKIELQHFGSGKTDGTVGAGVRRVWSGLGRQREPIWIGVRVGIAVISGQFDCGHGPPEPVVVFSLEQGNRTIGETDVQQGKQPRAMGQTEVMSQRRSLRNFVPEVLDVAIPESSNQGLFRRTSCAGDEAQTLDLIEGPCVVLAGQLRGRPGTEFVSARQGKRRDLRPLREVRRGEIGRRQLVVSRQASGNKRRRSQVRSVGAAERENLCGNGLSDCNAVRLVLPFRNLGQVLLKFIIEGGLKCWIQRGQDVMRRLVCRSWL